MIGKNHNVPWRYGMHRYGQKGASLLIVLLFVGVLGPFFGYLITWAQPDVRKAEAITTAQELTVIARGARLNVRDGFADAPLTFRNTSATPIALDFDDLQDDGYIPNLYNRVDAALTPITPLGQPIFIVRANWRRDGLGLLPATADDIPTGFVVIGPSPKINNIAEHVIANRTIEQTFQKANIQVRAPIFDIASGANTSPDCKGTGPAVALWDTGCMTAAEYATLRTNVPALPAFAAGTFIIPVWKTANLDTRAVMRFPQPENPGYATMLTDLTMAGNPQLTDADDPDSCVANVGFNRLVGAANPVPQNSAIDDICDVADDNGADNRFNIRDAGTLTADRIIAEPQVGLEVGSIPDDADSTGGPVETPTFGGANDAVINIAGRTTLNQDVVVLGRTPAGVAARPTGVVAGSDQDARVLIAGNLNVAGNTIVNTENPVQGALAEVGSLDNSRLIADNIVTGTLNTTAGTMNVENTVTTANMTNGGGDGLAAGTINALSSNPTVSPSTISVTSQMNVSDVLNIGKTGVVFNGNVRAGRLITGSGIEVRAGGETNISSTNVGPATEAGITTTNVNVTGTINASAKCLEESTVTGVCPNRGIVSGTISP